MNPKNFSVKEIELLLDLARQSVTNACHRTDLPFIEVEKCSTNLREEGASFVTLTNQHQLRGCIGAIEAYQPLVLDVIEHAAAAATKDYRFSPVKPNELDNLNIEVSVLSAPLKIDYSHPDKLLKHIQPGVHGVIIKDGSQRATFLPQVWKKLPDPEKFLDNLCYKMGVPSNLWKLKVLEVFIYEVVEFGNNK